MEVFLIIFSLFVIILFFSLAKKYNRNLFLFILSGVLTFLLSYYILSLLSIALFSSVFYNLSFNNEIVMGCFTIPFAIVITGVYYKLLEGKFKKSHQKMSIKNIGKE